MLGKRRIPSDDEREEKKESSARPKSLLDNLLAKFQDAVDSHSCENCSDCNGHENTSDEDTDSHETSSGNRDHGQQRKEDPSDEEEQLPKGRIFWGQSQTETKTDEGDETQPHCMDVANDKGEILRSSFVISSKHRPPALLASCGKQESQ